MKKNISVVTIPADESRSVNPFNYLLHAALTEHGVAVRGYRLKRLLQAKRFDLVHLHSPERFLSGKSLFGTYKSLFFFGIKIAWLKMRGKKLVWTVHHLFPFKAASSALTKQFYSLLFRYTDGFIAPTNHRARQLVRLGVPGGKIAVIPYSECCGHYPNSISREEAREKLGIPPDKFVFLFAGDVWDHGTLAGLIKTFHDMNDNESMLVIAGKIRFDVSNELEEWIQNDEKILVFPQFIEDEDLQFFFNSADMMIMPDQNAGRIGSAMLNLSFGKPMLLSKTENVLELQRTVGEAWIKTFPGRLNANHLRRSKAELERQRTAQGPDLSFFGRDRVAKATRAFYEAVLAGKRQPKINVTKIEGRAARLPLHKSKTAVALQQDSPAN
jgi:beta-1,4-mannosyltransferase